MFWVFIDVFETCLFLQVQSNYKETKIFQDKLKRHQMKFLNKALSGEFSHQLAADEVFRFVLIVFQLVAQ